MTLNEYQADTRRFAVYGKSETTGADLTYTVLALCGEAGELANKLKKHLRAGTAPDRAALADELGDVLWYVAAVAHELELPLEDVARMNLGKLEARRAAKVVTG